MSLVEDIKKQLAEDARQGSAEWEQIRIEKFTSSEGIRLMTFGERTMTKAELDARPKSGKGSKTQYVEDINILSDGALTYIYEVCAEAMTGVAADGVNSKATAWGEEHEHGAREWFNEFSGKRTLVMETMKPMGFYLFNEHSGGTPDDEVIGEDSIVEYKCPFDSGIHFGNMLMTSDKDLDSKYWWQNQFNMYFGKKKLCYHVSFDPRVKIRKHQGKIIEVPADPLAQAQIDVRLKLAITKKIELLTPFKVR